MLNTVQVHNLGRERNVGLFIYAIGIRGKKNFEAASQKLVLNKSNDLIFNPQSNTSYKISEEMKELKINWNLKMLELQEKGCSEKAILNTKIESQKLQDLEYLKQQSNPGPFTSTEQVKTFMEQIPESKEKNQQMYIEVRFQKNTSKFLKKDNAIYRLKRGRKNLPTSDYVFNLCCILTNCAVSVAYQWVIYEMF